MKALLLAIGGAVCCGVSYLFFRYVFQFVCEQFGLTLPTWGSVLAGVVGLVAACVSGYRAWKARGGLFGYHESALYHDLGEATAGAYLVDSYMHRITGPAYIFGQIFMAGPLGLLKSATLFKSIIPYTEALESDLQRVLAELRSLGRWKGLSDFPSSRAEILYLAQMRLIDFSVYHGEPRFRAY